MSMYAVNGDTITGIADAIRSKAGTSEGLTIASMAEAIANIPTGVVSVDSGTFTTDQVYPSSSFTYKMVEHNLGVIPDIVICILDGDLPTEHTNNCYGSVYFISASIQMGAVLEDRSTYSSAQWLTNFTTGLLKCTSTEIAFGGRSTNYPMQAGQTYKWWAIKL